MKTQQMKWLLVALKQKQDRSEKHEKSDNYLIGPRIYTLTGIKMTFCILTCDVGVSRSVGIALCVLCIVQITLLCTIDIW